MGAAEHDRIEREAQFHDTRFAIDGGTRSSTRFYAVARPSKDDFAARIDRIAAPAHVLELGCGPESVAWQLSERGLEVTGIDISSVAIDLARAEASKRGLDPERFRVMDAQDLDFDSDSFDAVIGSSILHHLDLDTALAGIARVLRPGGRALFYEPLGRNPAINLYRRLTPKERSDDERPLTVEDLDSIESHFDRVDYTYFHLTSLTSLALLRTKWFGPTASRLEAVDRVLFQRVPRTRTFAWVVVIEATVTTH